MSCALDSRLGMEALRGELLARIPDLKLSARQREEWHEVELALQNGQDLESALDHVGEEGLLETITKITGEFVATVDRECAFRIASDQAEWPATRLIKRIVDTLPEGDRILHTLTPNYDMLFEYACDSAGVPYSSGFSGGVQRKMDWDAVGRSMLLPEHICHQRKVKWIYKERKHVRLYKVHGSLNFFFHRGALIANDAWMWQPPDYAKRVIITPGLSKYETIQRYRQELLKYADAAIDGANRFLFLGYGFNDQHLEEYIRRKLIAQGCMGLVIVRGANPALESLVKDAKHLWIVCQAVNGSGTRIFNQKYSDTLDVPGKMLWKVAEFTSEILGG